MRDHVERLPTALVGWLVTQALLDRSTAGAQRRFDVDDVAAQRVARRLRAAMRGLVDTSVVRRQPAQRDLVEVNRWLRRPGILQLSASSDGVVLLPAPGQDPLQAALARLAEALASDLAALDGARLRVCANDDCRWAFYDTSRSGRRKWCDMTACGNRAKAQRHRDRRASSSASTTG
jgi:predicted RNA-binding Zn ribbon-like protein